MLNKISSTTLPRTKSSRKEKRVLLLAIVLIETTLPMTHHSCEKEKEQRNDAQLEKEK
jgi:hypothetical protein